MQKNKNHIVYTLHLLKILKYFVWIRISMFLIENPCQSILSFSLMLYLMTPLRRRTIHSNWNIKIPLNTLLLYFHWRLHMYMYFVKCKKWNKKRRRNLNWIVDCTIHRQLLLLIELMHRRVHIFNRANYYTLLLVYQ